MIHLGDEVKDIVTGFTGIAIARTEWINKCVRYGVQSQNLRDGKPLEASWFDSEQLQVIKPAAVVIQKEKTGGPPTWGVEAG